MSNDKPYTINVEVPTPPLDTKEPRTVPEILVKGLVSLINSVTRTVSSQLIEGSTVDSNVDETNLLVDRSTTENLGDNVDSVVYQDSDS